MKSDSTLIIYAHPQTKGHCSFILDNVKKYLKSKKIKHELIDLYKIKYDPVLKSEEHYSAGNNFVSSQNKKFQKSISKADKIIFIYPVWWGSMPSILKGFFERIFVSGFAFKFSKKGIPVKLLAGKRALVFMTTGSPTIFAKLFLGNRHKKMIKFHILEYCGIKTKVVQFGNARHLDQNKSKLENGVRKALDSFF
ncbi:NAD(P)H-dependent oxidoreductase [Candidatus Woesearchaeota archaeon]|jgi:NAD(P)H dehydrogenase (quinone)|nr:NAD(P)H-dependent oxidoreductase [Candidatus Woesearchaeota archaeon]MBT6519605.1 NAD(P)H-dependent oxidoreductase [Candidatus Woesearchaeota archaeon]MBT7367520.1 NAD(P)H-dependent oxidoreductase [Candidatus Woesearchaeota archaeon]